MAAGTVLTIRGVAGEVAEAGAEVWGRCRRTGAAGVEKKSRQENDSRVWLHGVHRKGGMMGANGRRGLRPEIEWRAGGKDGNGGGWQGYNGVR